MSKNLSLLLTLQSAILDRDFSQVEKLTTQMKKDFEQISVWHSLLANAALIQGKTLEARQLFQKALSLDPDNWEAKQYLEENPK